MAQVVIKIEFDELAKSITAHTKIEVTSDEQVFTQLPLLTNEILEQSKELFDKATAYSKNKTLEKL